MNPNKVKIIIHVFFIVLGISMSFNLHSQQTDPDPKTGQEITVMQLEEKMIGGTYINSLYSAYWAQKQNEYSGRANVPGSIAARSRAPATKGETRTDMILCFTWVKAGDIYALRKEKQE